MIYPRCSRELYPPQDWLLQSIREVILHFLLAHKLDYINVSCRLQEKIGPTHIVLESIEEVHVGVTRKF